MSKSIKIDKYTHVIEGATFKGFDTAIVFHDDHLVLKDVYFNTVTAVKGIKIDRIDMINVVHDEIDVSMRISKLTMLIRNKINGAN